MFFFTNLELLSFIVEYAVVFFHLNTNYRNVFSWLFNRTVFEMTASFCQTKRNPKLFSKCVLFSSSMCFRCQNYSPFSQLGNSFFCLNREWHATINLWHPPLSNYIHMNFSPQSTVLFFSGGENAKKKEQQYVSECPVNLLGFSFRQPPTM